MGHGDNTEDELERARDFTLHYKKRAAIWHGLMDVAEATEDDELWDEIGEIIIIAFNRDDVSAKISDHFVDKCPDNIFRKYALQGPLQFIGWRTRARAMFPNEF